MFSFLIYNITYNPGKCKAEIVNCGGQIVNNPERQKVPWIYISPAGRAPGRGFAVGLLHRRVAFGDVNAQKLAVGGVI